MTPLVVEFKHFQDLQNLWREKFRIRVPKTQWYTAYGVIQIYLQNENRPLKLQNQIGKAKKF